MRNHLIDFVLYILMKGLFRNYGVNSLKERAKFKAGLRICNIDFKCINTKNDEMRREAIMKLQKEKKYVELIDMLKDSKDINEKKIYGDILIEMQELYLKTKDEEKVKSIDWYSPILIFRKFDKITNNNTELNPEIYSIHAKHKEFKEKLELYLVDLLQPFYPVYLVTKQYRKWLVSKLLKGSKRLPFLVYYFLVLLVSLTLVFDYPEKNIGKFFKQFISFVMQIIYSVSLMLEI